MTDLPEDEKAGSSELRRRFADLGSVNVNAIEDYKELLERHTFLDGTA